MDIYTICEKLPEMEAALKRHQETMPEDTSILEDWSMDHALDVVAQLADAVEYLRNCASQRRAEHGNVEPFGHP